MLQLEFDGLPVSYNKHIQIIWHMKEVCLTPEAHLFKNRVKMSMPPSNFKATDKLGIEIEYHSNFQYANGKNKKIDIQNLDKLLIDAIFEQLGIDDSAIWKMTGIKVQAEKDRTMVRIDRLKDEEINEIICNSIEEQIFLKEEEEEV